MNETDLLYSKTHEWVHVAGDIATVGITRFAVDQLTDLVYVELPAVGKTMKVGDTFGVVESVKAVSDLYAPVSGEVVEVNAAVVANPALLSDDPYEKAWLLKMKLAPKSDLGSLLKKSEYDATAADH